MSKEQAKAWVSLEYFEIDLTFKRVQGNINEFEVNCYNECYKIGKLNIYIHLYIF